MSESCLKKSQPNDIIVWNDGTSTSVIGKVADTHWPMANEVDEFGKDVGYTIIINTDYIRFVVKIIKFKPRKVYSIWP